MIMKRLFVAWLGLSAALSLLSWGLSANMAQMGTVAGGGGSAPVNTGAPVLSINYFNLVQKTVDISQDGATSVSSYSVQALGPVAVNNWVIIGAFMCQINNTCTGTPTGGQISTISHTQGPACITMANAAITSSNGFRVSIWACKVTSVGSDTFSFTMVPAIAYPQFFFSEWSGIAASPDDGVGATATGSGTAVAVTTGATTQGGELIYSIAANVNSIAMTVTETPLSIGSASSIAAWYQTGGAAGVQMTNHATLASTNLWIAAIAAFKHQ